MLEALRFLPTDTKDTTRNITIVINYTFLGYYMTTTIPINFLPSFHKFLGYWGIWTACLDVSWIGDRRAWYLSGTLLINILTSGLYIFTQNIAAVLQVALDHT
jgi:hypothetical protein